MNALDALNSQVLIEKVLEQFKRGLITTQEARIEITEILFSVYFTQEQA